MKAIAKYFALFPWLLCQLGVIIVLFGSTLTINTPSALAVDCRYNRYDSECAGQISEASAKRNRQIFLSQTKTDGSQYCENCSLIKINIAGSNLSDATLNGSDFSESDLSKTNLRGARLNKARLFGANLSGADLTDAEINGADLRLANLKDAKVTAKQLFNTELYQTILPNGKVVDYPPNF